MRIVKKILCNIYKNNGSHIYKIVHFNNKMAHKTEILRGKIYEGIFISGNYSVVD